jgi:hypothetical protein
MATLANDAPANKPTFESALIRLEEIARAQAKLWRNPDTAEQKNVKLTYGKVCVSLSSSDLQLISDALDVLSPDSDESSDRAKQLCATFDALTVYQRSIE